MNAPSTKKLTSSLLSRWLGVSTDSTPANLPMQLVALEDRVLYSAGPIPAEVISGGDLLTEGDLQDVSANDVSAFSAEASANATLDYLQEQLDAANSIDSISGIQPLEALPTGTDFDDLVNDFSAESQPTDLAFAAAAVDAVSVATDLPSSERVAAAVSAGFDPGLTISGRIFHDVNGDGSVAENEFLENVEVRLFKDLVNGMLTPKDVEANGEISTRTDANGYYEFSDLEINETYFVTVVSTTLGEHFELNGLLNPGFVAGDLWGVQTYASEGALFDRGAGQEVHDGGAFYGGYDVDASDNPVNTADPGSPGNLLGYQHIIRHTLATQDIQDVDFGFSFNVVTNTLGGDDQDDNAALNQTVQGSLRQFIANANAIAGDNALRFVPVVDATETFSTGEVWRINVESALPTIVDAGTSVNGLAYTTDGSLITTTTASTTSDGVLDGFGVDARLLGAVFHPSLELSGLAGNVQAAIVAHAASFEDSKFHFATINVADRTSFNPATGAFSAELIQPASGWPVELSDGDEVAAIIIDGSTSDTSEFGLATSITLANEPADFDSTQLNVLTVVEGTPIAATIEATDPEGGNLEFSIVGGADASSFEIDSETGELSFVDEADFENPGDTDSNNSYSVTLRVQDEDGNGTERDFNVLVRNDANEIAMISLFNFEVDENQQETFFLEATASDENNAFTYEIVGGQDSSQFTVVANPDVDGRFGFQLNRVGNIDGTLPDYENPGDSNQDNIYELQVRATNDSGFTTTQTVFVMVEDVVEEVSIPVVLSDVPLPQVIEGQVADDQVNNPQVGGVQVADDLVADDQVAEPVSGENVDVDDVNDKVGGGVVPTPGAVTVSDSEEDAFSANPIVEPILSQDDLTEIENVRVVNDRRSQALNFDSSVYTNAGRTQFLDLANQKLTEVVTKNSISGQANFQDKLSLSQFLGGTAYQQEASEKDGGALNVGGFIGKNAQTLFAFAATVVLVGTGVTFTSSQVYRHLDVGSLLDDDDESIEDIVSS